MKARLFVSYYQDGNPKRNLELLIALSKNVGCKNIDEIYCFHEDPVNFNNAIVDEKVHYIKCDNRPTYSSMFDFINTLTTEEDINIVCNLDIWFNERAISLIKSSIYPNECYALSRWDEVNGVCQLYNHPDSQDVWAFMGKIKEVQGGFHMGVPGCDNRIAHEIEAAGYLVINPSKTIKTYHIHASQVRNYDASSESTQRIRPPYKTIWPTYLDSTKEEEAISIARQMSPMEELKYLYSYEGQKEQMMDLLAAPFNPEYKLGILIPTLYKRRKKFKALVEELERQIEASKSKGLVKVYYKQDSGIIPIGGKRNKLVIEAAKECENLVHFDDDDDPHENYVDEILTALEEDPDAVTFKVDVNFVNEDREMIIEYDHTWTTREYFDTKHEPMRMIKPPGHLCPMKRDICLRFPFVVIWNGDAKTRKERNDSGSDVKQIEDLLAYDFEEVVHIDKSLYTYNYDSNK